MHRVSICTLYTCRCSCLYVYVYVINLYLDTAKSSPLALLCTKPCTLAPLNIQCIHSDIVIHYIYIICGTLYIDSYNVALFKKKYKYMKMILWYLTPLKSWSVFFFFLHWIKSDVLFTDESPDLPLPSAQKDTVRPLQVSRLLLYFF